MATRKQRRKLWNICVDIYKEMYQKATPSADFEKLKEGKFRKDSDYEGSDPYLDYYLDEDKQQEIIRKHIEENNLNKTEKRKIKNTVTLGLSPAGTKEGWNKTEGETEE